MGSREERAFEVVVLAAAFRQDGGRALIAAQFPPSVLALFDAVVSRDEWIAATDLAQAALVVFAVLEEDASLSDRYQGDVDAGLLGFGAGEDDEMDAAIRAVTETLAHRDEPVTTESPPDDADPDDGLLGGGGSPWAPPVAAGAAPLLPPADAAAPIGADGDPPSETVATWLNASLESGDAALQPLQAYTLAVHFGEKDETAAGSQPSVIPFRGDVDAVDVTVSVVSSDFATPRHPQLLSISRDGRSSGRALFEVTPQHSGESTLSVVVEVSGNFLQRLDITFDVGGHSSPATTGYGRPAAAAASLGPRTATMQFMPTDGGYQLIAPQVSPDPIDIRVTPDQLAARIAAVRSVLLDTVKKRAVALELDISPEDNKVFLEALAFAGFRLFQTIFAGPEASSALKEVSVWLRDTLRDETTTLQVVSRGFPVPWALMYLTDRFDAAPLAWDRFVGLRHVVEQIPMVEITAVPPAPTIASTPALHVRTIYNTSIDDSMPSKPIAAQRDYWGARGVDLIEGTSVDELVKVGLAPGAADSVLYLYCHAEASSKDTDASKLILTGGTSVTLGQLQVYAPLEDTLQSHPLVFINACESGDLTPNFYDGFVPYFLAKGARGVIGTESKTPGLFASEWAKAFFDELFRGTPIGEVVLTLRKRFLEEHKNPLGLLYGVHCDTDTVVAPALAAAQPV